MRGAVADPPLAAALAAMTARLDAGARAPLAVGLSGGGDSLFLLKAALAWAGPRGRRVLALVVDHGLNPQSSAWTEFALATATRMGAEGRGLVWPGDKPASKLPLTARLARHRLLADACRDSGARVLLLGHTADDQAENAAMRAREGSGVGVIRPWSPSPVWPEGRGLFIARPLLGLKRADIRRALAAEGEAFIDDPANENQRFARARARAHLRDERQPVDETAGETEPGAAVAFAETIDGRLKTGRAALLLAPPEARRRAVLTAVVCASGMESPPRAEGADRLIADLEAGWTGLRTLGDGLILADPTEVQFGRNPAESRRGRRASPGVFDGRFALAAELDVDFVRGRINRLSRLDQETLRRIPAPYRGATPARPGSEGPRLARAPDEIVPLVGERLRSALGEIACEADIGPMPFANVSTA